MKLKLTKKRLGLYLEYHIIPLILLALISYGVFYYPLSKINEFKNYEKLNFFCEAGMIIDNDLTLDIMEKHSEILEVNYYAYSPNNININSLFEAFGFDSDILIMRETNLKDLDYVIDELFVGFDLTEQSIKFDAYTYNNKVYGFKVYDCNNQTYNEQFKFDQFISFVPNVDSYYMVLNKKSVNIGKFNSLSKTSYALEVYKEILTRY